MNVETEGIFHSLSNASSANQSQIQVFAPLRITRRNESRIELTLNISLISQDEM